MSGTLDNSAHICAIDKNDKKDKKDKKGKKESLTSTHFYAGQLLSDSSELCSGLSESWRARCLLERTEHL